MLNIKKASTTSIINNKINFLKDVLNECKSYNINQGYNPLIVKMKQETEAVNDQT
jgi:hypothetical protein